MTDEKDIKDTEEVVVEGDEVVASEDETAPAYISYADFKKVEMRIGEVVSAERVPETDKLIKCVVDFGDWGERQIVSGIADRVEPEYLVGKKFPYVLNIEPRTIRGVESQGMILAVSDSESGELGLLSPHTDITPGSSLS